MNFLSRLIQRRGLLRLRSVESASSINMSRSFTSKVKTSPFTKEEPYINWGMSQSYFTCKVSAAFLFYPFQYEFKTKTVRDAKRLEAAAGTHRIPVVETADGKVLEDSTVIMMHLDEILAEQGKEYHNRQMYGEGMHGVVVHVLEEYFDEYYPRNALLMRWWDEATAGDVRAKMGQEILPAFWEMPFRGYIGRKIHGWGVRAMRATGLEHENQKEAGREECVRTWTMIDKQLRQTPFLLGNKPCALDCVVLGGMWGHFTVDLQPKELMIASGLDRLLEWGDRNYKHPEPSEWGQLENPESTPFAEALLTEMTTGPYKQWMEANSKAVCEGKKSFMLEVYGIETSFLARNECEKARRRVRDRVRALRGYSDVEHQKTVAWLQKWGLSELYGGEE